MPSPLSFPAGAFYGASTASHQVEGGNSNNQWWQWEQLHQPVEKRSGAACEQWHRFREDIQLMKTLGHTMHRFSIEWSRIEPTPGQFDKAAMDHYVEFAVALKEAGIEPLVTLHHFTNPIWFEESGGWEQARASVFFTRYVEYVVQHLKSQVHYWVTINEPSVYAFMSFHAGAWPPQEKSTFKQVCVLWNMARAHRAAYRVIHAQQPSALVGVAHNMTSFVAHTPSWLEKTAAWVMQLFNNRSLYWLTGTTHDFVGINYYFHRRIEKNPDAFFGFRFVDPKTIGKPVSDMGWELYPQGLLSVFEDIRSLHRPIFITEHGLASTDDTKRVQLIEETAVVLNEAVSRGFHLGGYLHWSLLDNFEWADGFWPRFGLIEIDYATQERKPRPSAWRFKDFIQS